MTAFIFWSLWVICAALTYVLARREQRQSFGKWTQCDRLFWLGTSLFGGPFMLLALLLIGLAIKIDSTKWAKREVRW